ncbi:MAG: OsmC family protein [Chloroflexi bacterium]|nr:OsmC family protein [Chloroflexota bacterium]
MSKAKTVRVEWTGQELEFNATFGSGFETTMSSRANKTAGSPMEFLLGGVAGCTAIDVVSTLQKMRQTIHGVSVEINGTRAETYPMVYTKAELVYIVKGENVSENAVQRAINLSKEKYCSASIMFQRAGVDFSISYQIEEETTP